jgi:hypothetical protein
MDVDMKNPGSATELLKVASSFIHNQDRNRKPTLNWMKHVLCVSANVAELLYDEQQLTSPQDWSKLNDGQITSIEKHCRADGHNLPVRATAKLKLLVFATKHSIRTSRPVTGLVDYTEDMPHDLRDQMEEEERYFSSKGSPDPPVLPLDDNTATKSFAAARQFSEKERGNKGVPLSRVIRPSVTVIDAYRDPAFNTHGTTYSSYDNEMITRAPILSPDPDATEEDGPFDTGFIADSVKVFSYLQGMFGKTPAWIGVKKYIKTKPGRVAWMTLNNVFFGTDKISTIENSIRNALKNLQFNGPRKGWSIQKYTNMHIELHVRASDTMGHSTTATQILSKQNKIYAYMEGITDPAYTAIKCVINAALYLNKTFDQVKDQILNASLSISPTPQSGVSTVKTGGQGRRQISQTGTTRNGSGEKAKPSQTDIDACTHITRKKYTASEYSALTPSKKAKKLQLDKAFKDKQKKWNVSETTTAGTGSATTMTNSTNPALGCQDVIPKKQKTEDE